MHVIDELAELIRHLRLYWNSIRFATVAVASLSALTHVAADHAAPVYAPAAHTGLVHVSAAPAATVASSVGDFGKTVFANGFTEGVRSIGVV